MKKLTLLGLGLVALTLSSCHKDDKTRNKNEGTETYWGVSVSFPKTITTRADINANVMESAVTSIGVYIVDDNSGVMHSGIFDNTAFTETAGTYSLNSAVKTTTGSKKMYVVLNPSAALQSTIGLLRGTVFEANAIDGTAAGFVTPTDLVMSSETATQQTLVVQTSAGALSNPVVINAQRNTAKVAVKEKSASTPVVGGTVSNLEYALVVDAKKSYLIQQGGNTLATVVTPGKAITSLTATNDYFTKLATPISWKSVNGSGVANKNLVGYYTLENVNTTKVEGNTTAAIIRAQYTPTNVVVGYVAGGTRTMGTIIGGTSFYVKKSDNSFWNEAAYTAALASDFVAADFSLKYDNGIGYFRIWVQDANEKVGVIRGHYYVLSITKITGPGLPYVPGVDPSNPGEPEDPNKPLEVDTFISAEVTIVPWAVDASDHDL